MNLRVLSKFARKNLKTNKVLILPFVLSSSFMFMLFYVMESLSMNSFVVNNHATLSSIISFGNFLIAVFSVIFVLYSNNILDKQRAKEFALYSVLGLEKKHIAVIVFIEKFIMYLISCVLSITGGYVFGKLLFVVLAKGLNERVDKLTTVYNFMPSVALLVAVFMACVYLLIYFINVARISTITPIALLSYGKKVESEPKVKIIFFIMGLLFLGGGYYIALTTKGIVESLFLFFLATILVIIGTYLLFTSMTIFVLKLLRKNKRFYHKPKNFLSISGMLYRMKSNAVGLATICIFSTSVILSLGTTASIYSGLESVVKNIYPNDYNVSIHVDSSKMTDEQVSELERKYIERVYSTVSDRESIKNVHSIVNLFAPVNVKNNNIQNIGKIEGTLSAPRYLNVLNVDTYNKVTKSNVKLAENELILVADKLNLSNKNIVNFIGQDYKVRSGRKVLGFDENIDLVTVVLPSYKEMSKALDYYSVKGDDTKSSYFNLSVKWDSKDNSDSYANKVMQEFDQEIVIVKKEQVAHLYELNGGFLFLGFIIATIFLAGTVLITYYKRISEAYDDRVKYQIMQKLGLEDSLIKKTSRTQIIWMFFLPLLVACVHCVFASKILSELLILFGVSSYVTFVSNVGIVLIGFAIVYLIVFAVTSKLVYKMVK